MINNASQSLTLEKLIISHINGGLKDKLNFRIGDGEDRTQVIISFNIRDDNLQGRVSQFHQPIIVNPINTFDATENGK